MSQNIVEKLREEAVKSLFNPDNKFILAWPTWQPLIRGLANTPTATQIINLGDHLHDIFQSTAAIRLRRSCLTQRLFTARPTREN